MKVVILAGGLGTRISEETSVKPKPMVEIGGKPILWHIMKIYSEQGFKEFIICLGYKGYFIKEWFSQYYLHNSDVTFDLAKNEICYHKNRGEDWKVTLVDTGDNTMTGGRIKRIKDYVNNETFMATYGDGVGDVNIKELLKFHKKHGKIATVTATLPEGRFGVLKIEDDNMVSNFSEKTDNQGRVNGGFFVFEPKLFDYIPGDDTILEYVPLPKLAEKGELYSWHHEGFWKPMDTLSDKQKLEALWESGKAPWKTWK
ncbi:MAG: glucose-1-phosphate cytidylyltransferase [Patescibacteria group bacterium]|jgi:glucose-1-phosphate cytidylyltransferase|nr:glucose-1-phosphate cytidylyltransferase [Patescibacteria group bacterium]